MRAWRWLFPIVVLILFSTGVPRVCSQKRPPQKPPSATRAEAQEGIAVLQKNVIAASMAFDVSAMLDVWTDDAVLLPPRHAPIIGKAALRRYFQEKKDQYANYDMLAYDEQWDEVMVIGEYAYQWGTVSYRMKPPTGGEFGATVNALRILKRDEGDYWRVARAMWNEGPM